jgi:hypothetical protein
LSVGAPIIAAIARDQAAGVNDIGAVFTLLIACIIFAMLIRQVLTMTARLTAAWRLPFLAERPAASADHAVQAERRAEAASANERIAGMVASVSPGADAPATPRTVVSGATVAAGFEKEPETAASRRASRAYRGFGSSRVRAAGGYR